MKVVNLVSGGAAGLLMLSASHALAADPTADPKVNDPSTVPVYATPADFELGPAVQFGGPHPFPVGVGGRVGMLFRVHRYFSFGWDVTFTQTAAKKEVFNAPIGGSHWRMSFRLCTHASIMHFCAAGGLAGMSTVSADNVPRSGFPNDLHFLPMIDVGATWKITDWLKVRPIFEGGVLMGVPATMVDDRPDQVYEPFPLFGTLSLNLAFAIPTTIKPGESL
jgi:hypothetical protein